MGYRSLRVINDDPGDARHGLRHPSAPGHGRSSPTFSGVPWSTRIPWATDASSARGGAVHVRRVRASCTASSIRPATRRCISCNLDSSGPRGRYAAVRGEVHDGRAGWCVSPRDQQGRGGLDPSRSIRMPICWLARLQSGQTATHRLAAGRHAWLHVAEGDVTVQGQALSEAMPSP